METGNTPKILIVDDEKGLRLGTKRLLEREGYEVSAASCGTEGIALGTSEEYDLAIIDLKMPDFDGTEVLKAIIKKYPNTVCFIATAYASYETAIESTKLGAFSYIPKPFLPEELLRQVTKGLEKRQLLEAQDKWQKEREERLLEVAFEKTRLNTIINSISDGLLVINKDGEAVLFNPSALIYLDLQNLAVEQHVLTLLHPDIKALVDRFLNKEQFEHNSFSAQIEIKPDNKLFIEATCSPVPHPDGSLAGVVLVLKNITELKKLEQLKSQFVSMVSHELKAPVAAVYGYLKLLTDGSIRVSAEQQQSYLNRSIYRLDSLLKMVNDLLDISRIEMKRVQREIKELNTSEIISSVIELLQFDINNKNINVVFSADEALPLIKADYDEILRLYTNLISNAVKYNKDNGSLNITVSVSGNYLVTEIKDTGIGLKPDELKRLFNEFFRAKNEKTREISGTGLGLSIVKRIVDNYAGKIEIDSEFDKGTCVTLHLPLHV